MNFIEQSCVNLKNHAEKLVDQSIILTNKKDKLLIENLPAEKIRNSIRIIISNPDIPTGTEGLINTLEKHLNIISKYLPFCSTVDGFKNTWGFKNGKELSLDDKKNITDAGGNLFSKSDLITACTSSGDELFITSASKLSNLRNQQGVILSENGNFVSAVKCHGDKFEDVLDNVYIDYCPNLTFTGSLRFRFMEELAPLVVLVVIWVKYCNETKFCISPAKVINKNDTSDYLASLGNPLSLQLISVSEAETLIKHIKQKLEAIRSSS